MSLYDDEKKYGDGTNAATANLADNKMQEAEAISANAEVVAGSVDDQDTKPDYETGVDIAPEQAAPVVKDEVDEEPQNAAEVSAPETPVVDAPEPVQETKVAPSGFDDWWNSIDNGVKFGIRDAGCDVQRAYKLAPQEDKDAFVQAGQGFNLFYENPDTKEYEGMYKVGSDGAQQMRDWYEELTPEGENMRRFYDLMEVDGYYRLVPKDITGNGARSVYYLAFRDAEDPESATLMTAGDLSVDRWGKFAADSTNPFLIEVREFNAGDEVKEGCSYQVDILDENGEVVDSNVYDAEQFAQIDPASLANATVRQLDYSLNVAPGELTDRIKGFDHTPETILSQYNKRNNLLEEEKINPWLNGDWQKQFGDKVKGESPMDRGSKEYMDAKAYAEKMQAEHDDKLRSVAKVINAYDAKYVSRGLDRVNDMINEHMKGLSPEMKNFIATQQAATLARSMTATSPMPAISGLEVLMMGKGEVATELTKQAQLDAAKEYFSQAKAIHESPWDDASGWDSFWAGVRDAVIDEDTWIDGMKEAWANETMAPLLAKIRSVAGNLSSNTLYGGDFFDVVGEDGKPVFSEEEKMLLQAFLAKEDAQMSHLKFANDFYQDGVSAFKSALFTAKFLIGSGSAGTVGESLAENLAKSLQKMGPRFGKFVAYGIANLVEGGLRTVMTPGTFSRAHANSLIEPTAFGYKVAEGKELMANMAKSYVDDTIENWSELVFRGAASGLLDDAVLNFIGPETRAALKALNQSPMGRAARATGMGGLPEEGAEEWVAAATRAIFIDRTDKDENGIPDSFEDFVKLENQMHMAISFSLTMIPGGAMMEVNRAAKALDFQDYMARTEEGLRKAGREDLVATWRELINGSDYEQLQQILVDVVHTTAKMDATNAAQIAENAIEAIYAKSAIRAIDQRTPQATMDKIDAAAASLQERLGGAFVMDGDKVRVITGANGTRRFVYTKPEKGGKKPMQEVILQEGVAPQIVPFGYADAMLADESATDFQSEQVTTRNQYILGTLVEGENAAENDRMANERRTQIAALQQGMKVGSTINIGTLETPNMVVVGGASQDGKSVMVQDANGQIVPISWEIYAATPEINQPIHVKTQEEYFNEQVERQRQRNAEAREQGVKDAEEQHYDKQHIATPVAKEEPVQETGREEAEATVAAHEEASTEASQGKIAMEAAERDREVGAFYEKDADGNVVMGPDGKPAIMWEQLWNANPGLWAKYKDKENGGNTAATNKALRDNLDGLVIRAREVENALAETPGDETLQRERAALEARRNQLASIIDTREQASIQKEAMQAAKQLATEGEEAEDARAYVESKVAEAQGVLADVQSNEPAYQQGQSLEEYTNARKIYREALRKAQRNLAVWERVAATHKGMVTGQQFREQVQQTELQPSQIEGMSDEQYTAALAAQAAYNERQTESGRNFQEMVAKRVAEWKEKYGVKVNVINSIEEIPETEKAAFAKAYQEMARGGNGLQGWMSPSTGEAYVFAPLLTSIGELDKTLMHEVVAHKGLRNIMGAKAYDELCDDVWANVMSDYQKEFFMNYARSTGRYDETKAADMIKLHRAAADEFLAFTSEQNTPEALENLSFGEKLTGGIRDALRSLGFSGELNNKDLKWMLARSLQKSDEEDGRNLMRKISQSIGGTIDGSSETRFSVTAQAEGAGLQVLKDDGDGNVAFVHPVDGRIFNANNLLTAADLKSMPESVMQYMIADAHAVGTVDDAKEWMLWNRYAMILNAILIKGSAENGGFEYLASQWQWIAESVYKTVAPNSDTQYSYSLDITRVCKKNEAVINSIAETQRRLGYGITPGQIMDIYLSTIEEGYQVPCPVCYVFSRYIRNGKYATIMINGQEKYGSQLVDPRTLSEAEYLEKVKYWKNELKKAQKLAEQNKDIIARANQDITTLLDDIDNLAKQLTDPNSGLTDEQRESIKAEIRALDAKYRAALNVVSQSSLDSWITQFAIHQVKENGRKKWVLYDDTYQGFPKEMALDLRETATVMREYPAIQRYRNSRGAAAGKEITFASNNDLGDLPMALGSVGATKSLARPKEMSPEEWRSLKQDEYGALKGGVKNLYQQAFTEKDPEVKKALLTSARKRFKAAHLYAKQQSLRGGQRMWSWSDNIERLGPDVFVNLMQLEMLGGALQAYSKQLEGIKHVATLGGYVNGSLMGKGNGYKEITADEIETGEDGVLYYKDGDYIIGEPGKKPEFVRTPVYEQDGKYYVLEFDDVVGVQPFSGWGEDSKGNKVWHKGLFELNRELDKAGNIIVGMNDLHVRMAMADDRIFFIIPWHSSGANNHILSQMYQYLNVLYDVKQSQDYTKVQEEKRFKSAKVKDEELTEEEKLAQEGNEDVEEDKTPGIKQEVIDFWEDHYNNPRNYAGQMLSGKSFDLGTAPIESGKNGQLSEGQEHYRQLRDAIFIGVKVRNGVDKNGKDKFRTVAIDKLTNEDLDNTVGATPAWFDEIMNDAFLRQAYMKVREVVGETGYMTSTDCKYIYPYEYWDMDSTYDTADVNAARYLEYCRRLGYKPKFCGKLDGKPENDFGNFADDKGYWKLLIDRRMYDRFGNFQDLTPVSAERFNPDLVDPVKTAEEFDVTRVADEAGTNRIVDATLEREAAREGGIAKVDYSLDLSRAINIYKGALNDWNAFKNTLKEEDRRAFRAVEDSKPMDEAFADAIAQSFSSAATSINKDKLPSAFGKIKFVSGTVNLDLGGGKFDNATEFLKEQGVENLVFDPFNRDSEHNRKIAEAVRDGKVDTVTCNNCLNVIDSERSRDNVILQASKAIKPDGVAYFSIYEGNKSGIGRQTGKDQWQNNMATADYVPEIEKHFGDVVIRKGIIEAREPIASDVPSVWSLDGKFDGENEIRFRSIDITPEVRQEMENIEAMARINGTYMKAPNGADTKLNPEQWALTRTKAFKDWFGDWENDPENASKVIDENGEPMVVYHGTMTEFNTFDKDLSDSTNEFGQGMYFSDAKAFAERYASLENNPDYDHEWRVLEKFEELGAQMGLELGYEDTLSNEYVGLYNQAYDEVMKEARIIPAFINIRNPYIQTESEIDKAEPWGNNDGVIDRSFTMRHEGFEGNQYVVFDPNQVKSATDNNGEFSTEDNDIRFSAKTDENGYPFVLASNGSENFGIVTGRVGMKDAPIKLSLGFDRLDDKGVHHGYGLAHIIAERESQIKEAGYDSVVDFVETVAANYTTVKEGNMRGDVQTYLLELTDEHNNTLYVELSSDGTYWNVNSGGVFRKGYSEKKKVVPSVLEVGGSIDNSSAEVQGDEVINPMSENSSGTTLSDIKDTNSSENSNNDGNVFRAVSSEGAGLSVGQQKYFANSKAVDKDGNLLTLYHGTSTAGFNEFRSGWFTTSKKDADSYGGNDREGKLYDPEEQPSSEVITAGDYRLGYMTFDSEEDRAAFLAKHPLAEEAMTEDQLREAIDNADYEGDYDRVEELESKQDEYKAIAKDYRDYEFDHLVTTTWNDLLSNPYAYTENDFRRAFLAYDSNAIFDEIDDMDPEDRIDAYIDALNYAVEETLDNDGDALSIEFRSRVPRNGEGIKVKDMRHRTYKVYVNVENPYEIDAKGKHSEFESGAIYDSIKGAMADPQYDGVIVRNWRVGRYQQVGDVVVPKAPNQIKLTSNLNPSESTDIRFRAAFHGTNADFDKFESGHLLEGEGHLAHGAGVYVAMNEDRGRAYADKVAAYAAVMNGDVKHNGESLKYRHIEEMNNWRNDLKDVPLDEIILEAFLWAKSIDLDKVDNALWNKYDYLEIHDYNGAGRVEEALDYFRQHKDEYTVENQSRYLYSLEIPDDNGSNYLDEQKVYEGEEAAGIKDRVTDSLVRNGVDVDSRSGVLIKSWNEEMANTDKFAGAYLYSLLAMEMNNDKNDLNETAEAASKILSDAGFVGIKYDGRVDGECAVIFNPEDIEITDKVRFRMSGENATFDELSNLISRLDDETERTETNVVDEGAEGNPLAGLSRNGEDGEVRDILFRAIGEEGAKNLDDAGIPSGRAKSRMENLALAISYKGNDPLTIKRLTGWEFSDGQWKYEEPDFLVSDLNLEDGKKLSEVIDDKSLFVAYPQLADVEIRLVDNGKAGVNYGDHIEIDPNYASDGHTKEQEQRLTLIHEIQHLIQGYEGWPAGISSDNPDLINAADAALPEFKNDLWNIIKKTVAVNLHLNPRYEGYEATRMFVDKWGIKPTRALDSLGDLRDALIKAAYRNSRGEVDARISEARADYSEEELNSSLRDEQNIRFRSVADSGEVANVIERGIPQVSDVMLDLFANAPASVKNAVAEDAARNGFRFDNAMAKYLADRATRFDLTGDDKALMDEAVARISSAAGVPMNELDARWAMWNEAHRGDNTTVGLAQRIATGIELGHDPVTDEMKQKIADDVRFRAISSAHDDSALSIYGREMGFWFAINETWKNQFESVKVLQDAIAKAAGKEVQDFEDADNRLNLMPARIRDDKEKYVRDFLNPMWDVIKALGLMGISQKRIEEYVLAKSGLERNVLFAKRDAKAEYKKILDENLEKLKKYQSATPAVQAAMDNDLQKQINDAQQYISDRTNDLALATTPAEVRAINKDIAKAQKELDGLLLDQQRDAQAYTDDYDRHIIDVDMEVDEKYLENRKTDYSGLTSLYDEVPELKKRRGESPQEFRERVKSQTTHPFPKVEDAEFEAQLQVTLFEQDAEILNDKELSKIGKEPGKGVRYGHYQVGTDMAKELWDRINAATNEILRHQLEYGMINQETHDNLVNMMQYYVPLRGFDQETAEEAYSYKHEGSPVSVPVRKAKGRRSRAADPFANIAVMAESGITMDHKNHAKMALYNLVANTPENDAAQIADSWFEYTGHRDTNGKKIYKKVYPEIKADMTPADITAAWETLNNDMEARKQSGDDVKHGKSELDLYNEVVFVDRNQKPEHVISVKVDGADEDIIIQGNPRVAQAIEGKLNIESSDNPIYKALSALTRLRAGLSTSWNPEFVETNFIRDAQTAFTTAFVEDGIKGVGDYLSAVVRCAKMYRLASNYERTPLEKSVASGLSSIEKNHPQLVEWYKEFRESGATTGFSHLQDNAEYEDQLRKFTNPTTWEKLMLGISEKLEWLQFINDGVENLWRFAAYVNAREKGESIDMSAHAAKEITVNFNRKGSGLVWGPKDIKGLNLSENDAVRAFQQATIMLMTSPAPALRTAVMFVNATVQGLVKTMGLFEKSPARAALSIGIGYFVFGAINSLLQQIGGDDDDDKQRNYLSLSEQERRENFSFRVPGLETGYVKIALPQEYRIFYALGDMVVSDMFMKNDPSESVVDKTWESLWELTPWNLSHWKDAGDVLRNSGVGPFYDVVKNENFMGMNVYNDKKYAQDDDKEFVPEWQYATRYADPVLVEICKWLSDITGGDELGFYAGRINLNPDIVQTVFEGYAGGALTTLKKFGDVYNMATGKQEFTFRRTPFLSRLFADVEEKNSSTYVNGLYDFYMQELQHRFKALDGPTGYNKTDDVDAPKNLSNDPIARAYTYALANGMIETSKQEKTVSDKKLKSLNERKKELQSKIDDPEPHLNIGYTEEEKQEYLDYLEQQLKETQDLINDHKWNFVRRLNEAYYKK